MAERVKYSNLVEFEKFMLKYSGAPS